MHKHHRCSWQVSILTIDISARIELGELLPITFLQMNSDSVGSSSPIYSIIFLLTHGFIRRSMSVYRGSNEKIKDFCLQNWVLTSTFNIKLMTIELIWVPDQMWCKYLLKVEKTLIFLGGSVAILDLSNWRGSAPVFCGTPKGEGSGRGRWVWNWGGLTLNWGS